MLNTKKQQTTLIVIIIIGRIITGLWLTYNEQLPFIPLSFDDYSRSLMAYRWDEWVGVWLPVPIFITGTVMRLLADYWLYAPATVNILASAGSMWMLYSLSLTLFRRFSPALITVMLVALLPWPVWLSVSGLPNSLFQLFVISGLWGFVMWLETEKPAYLFYTSLPLMLAEMTRYEVWSLGFIIYLYAIYRLRHKYKHPFRLELVILSPLILFPLLWLALNFWKYGDPLYFSHFVQARSLVMLEEKTITENISLYMNALTNISPLLFATAMSGLFLFGQQNRPVTPYLIIWSSWFISLIISAVMGNQPSHLPIRVVITPFLLLAPMAGYALFSITEKWQKLWPAVAVVLVISGVHLTELNGYPLAITDELRIMSRGLRILWSSGFLDEDNKLLIERYNWNFWPIKLFSGHPDNVWIDSSPPADLQAQMLPLILAEDGNIDLIKAENFKIVLIYSNTAATHLSKSMVNVYAGQFYKYKIFVFPEDEAEFYNILLGNTE